MSAQLIDAKAERKLPPLNLPKENVEAIVALLGSKKSSAIVKERTVEVVANLGEEEVQGASPTPLAQCDAIALVCRQVREDEIACVRIERLGQLLHRWTLRAIQPLNPAEHPADVLKD